MLLNKTTSFVNFMRRQAYGLRQLNSRLKPELGFAILRLNMHVYSRFLTREEIETKTAFTKNCWTHGQNDTR
jgi:hypothetical protein